MAKQYVTIQYSSHKLDVQGYATPAEKQEEFYPGCDAEFEISAIYIGEHPDCIMDLFSDHDMADIAALCLMKLESNDGF